MEKLVGRGEVRCIVCIKKNPVLQIPNDNRMIEFMSNFNFIF